MTTEIATTNGKMAHSPRNTPAYAKDKDRPYEGDPWSRQPNESAKSYGAFKIYLDLGDKRTVAEANRRYRQQEGLPPKDSGQPCARWSMLHRWVERADAYSNFMDAKVIAANKRAAIAASQRHAEQARDIAEVLMRPVDVLRERLQEQGDMDFIATMDDDVLLKLAAAFGQQVPAAQKAEREALQSTSNAVAAPIQVKAKGELVRRVLADKSLIGMMEQIAFSVEATEPADEG